jgi:hypothetical protein
MLERPRTYGLLPSGRRSDPDYIKYVYENYGKPEPDFLMGVADFLQDFIGEIPVIGDIFKPVNKFVQSKIPDKDAPKKGEELQEIDYTKGYDKYQQLLNPEEAMEEQQQVEQQEQELEQQKKDILGHLGRGSATQGALCRQGFNGYALHAVIVKKPVSAEEINRIHSDFFKNKKHFMKETKLSIRMRNIPKTKFEPKSFKSKKINNKITLVYGKLKPELRKKYLSY